MDVTVTTWYVEMLDRSWLRPSTRANRGAPPGMTVLRAEVPSPELGRFLYTAVGGDWWWTNRLTWTYDRWLTHLDRPDLQTWVGYVSGTPAGYFELERQAGEGPGTGGAPRADVEIVQFGLLPRFVGCGLGGALLTAAVERAWAMGADPAEGEGEEAADRRADESAGGVHRVWLHTCSLDGPHALPNYLARGFRVFRTETRTKTLSMEPPGPWPGARALTPG